MNKIYLIGRLTKDPETRYTSESVKVARFTLAINRKTKEKEQADFVPCVTFGYLSDFSEKYLKKGLRIAIEGEWRNSTYTNKENKQVTTHFCVVNNIEFCEKKEENTENPQNNGFQDINDLEVPFN